MMHDDDEGGEVKYALKMLGHTHKHAHAHAHTHSVKYIYPKDASTSANSPKKSHIGKPLAHIPDNNDMMMLFLVYIFMEMVGASSVVSQYLVA